MNNDVECFVKTSNGYVESVGHNGITFTDNTEKAFVFPCLESAFDMKETFYNKGIECEIIPLDEE